VYYKIGHIDGIKQNVEIKMQYAHLILISPLTLKHKNKVLK